ncbi:MAG: tetratricopeptide repeat protein [bacterium]|nr:tetratricopeptide repeat protein [bacterium]
MRLLAFIPLMLVAHVDDAYRAGLVALREERQASQFDPEEPRAWLSLAQVCLRKGEFAEAAERLERAVELSPKSPPPHLVLARVYLRLGNKDEASRERDLFQKLRDAEDEAVHQRSETIQRLKIEGPVLP